MSAKEEMIGVATMSEDGTIKLFLRAEDADGNLGDAMINYEPTNPEYESVLKHLGGLEVGEEKPVPPWP